MTETNLHQCFEDIWTHIQAAQSHLDAIQAEMTRLEQDGMYPAVPTEQWQNRDGKGNYLYHLFTMDHEGKYTGPEGKRKVYVGNKPDRIEAARHLATNRARYESLAQTHRRLDSWIYMRLLDIDRLADHTEQWPYDHQILDAIDRAQFRHALHHPPAAEDLDTTTIQLPNSLIERFERLGGTLSKGILILARHRPPDDPEDWIDFWNGHTLAQPTTQEEQETA